MELRFCDDLGADSYGWIVEEAMMRTSHALASDAARGFTGAAPPRRCAPCYGRAAAAFRACSYAFPSPDVDAGSQLTSTTYPSGSLNFTLT